MQELPLIGGRPAIGSDALSDAQSQTLDALCGEEASLRAAFNDLLREKGLDLELVGFHLGPARAPADQPIFPEPPEHPPPGGCYCCVGGACYCC